MSLSTTPSLQQRIRLQRSAPKVGAILGSSPYLPLDIASPGLSLSSHDGAGRHNQDDMLFSFSSTSASDEAMAGAFKPVGRRARHSDDPPVRTVQLQPMPVISSHSDATKPLPSLSPTILTSTSDLNLDVDFIRRRTMAKVTRMLGEDIPPELVFPSSSGAFSTLGRTQLKESGGCSFRGNALPTTAPVDVASPLPTPITPSVTTELATSLRPIFHPRVSADTADEKLAFADLQMVSAPESEAMSTPRSSAESSRSDSLHGSEEAFIGSSRSLHAESQGQEDVQFPVSPTSKTFGRANVIPRSRSPSPSILSSSSLSSGSSSLSRAFAASRNRLPLLFRQSSQKRIPVSKEDSCRRRKEHAWSGEWNRADMEDVLKGLRELKGAR